MRIASAGSEPLALHGVHSVVERLGVRAAPDLYDVAPGGARGIAADLPPEIQIGEATVQRYRDERLVSPEITISARVPLPTAAAPGTVLDLAQIRFGQVLPHRCVLSDGTPFRAFIGIDSRAGTPLDRELRLIEKLMPPGGDPESVYEWLRAAGNKLLRPTDGAAGPIGSADLPWDRALSPPDSEMEAFRRAAALAVGDPALATGILHPVVPLERYLDVGYGYCLQRCFVESLLLERRSLSHRVVMGATIQGPGATSGHTWIELPDGRVLDPTWGLLEQKGPGDAAMPGSFGLAGGYRFANASFPYLALD
jgi:hypothetical protein